MLHRLALACFAIALAWSMAGCRTNERIAFVNPTDRPLFVQLNERPPFEVAPHSSTATTLPSLERLQPLAVTARNARGDTVFFVATSLTPLVADGRRLEMIPNGVDVDPFASAGALPYLLPTAHPSDYVAEPR